MGGTRWPSIVPHHPLAVCTCLKPICLSIHPAAGCQEPSGCPKPHGRAEENRPRPRRASISPSVSRGAMRFRGTPLLPALLLHPHPAASLPGTGRPLLNPVLPACQLCGKRISCVSHLPTFCSLQLPANSFSVSGFFSVFQLRPGGDQSAFATLTLSHARLSCA